jgi:hypothetical protein
MGVFARWAYRKGILIKVLVLYFFVDLRGYHRRRRRILRASYRAACVSGVLAMKIWDPIYGAFQVPGFIAELLTAPEIRRLSNIRLLNTLTPSLATLGEVRRYSHTLGVIFLATKHTFFGYDGRTIRAFFAAVLLHDMAPRHLDICSNIICESAFTGTTRPSSPM